MDGLDVVMVIAIILFARLGVRLISQYIKLKNDKMDKPENND